MKARYIEGFAVAFMLVSTLLVFNLEAAFRTDPSEFPLSLARLMVYGALVSLGLSSIIGAVGLSLPERPFRVVAALSLALAYLFHIQSHFFLWDYGFFGDDFDYERFDRIGWFEAVVWAAGLIIAWRYAAWILRHLAELVAVLLFMQIALVLVDTLSRHGLWDSPTSHWEANAELFEFSDEGNILLVLLDGFKGTFFDRALAELVPPPEFEGFTYFPDTLAAFNYTEMSIPAILSGAIYQNAKTVDDFMAVALGEESIPERLAQRGFTSHIWTDEFFCPFFQRSRCVASISFDEVFETLRLANFALFRSLPHFAKKPLRLEREALLEVSGGGAGHPEQRNAFELIKRFEKSARVVDGPATFKFLHLLLPHWPYVFDSDCRDLPEQIARTSQAYLTQAACSLKITDELLATLKRIGIYDSSLVIVISDHGSVVDLGEKRHVVKTGTSRALFLVKPPNSHGSWQSLPNLVSVSDLPSTIVSIMGIDEAYPGQSAFAPQRDLERARLYLTYDGKVETDGLFLPRLKEHVVRGPAKLRSSWSSERFLRRPEN